MFFYEWRGNWHLLVAKDGYTFFKLLVRLTFQFQSIWQILRERNIKKQKASECPSDSQFQCHADVTHWITPAHSLKEIGTYVEKFVQFFTCIFLCSCKKPRFLSTHFSWYKKKLIWLSGKSAQLSDAFPLQRRSRFFIFHEILKRFGRVWISNWRIFSGDSNELTFEEIAQKR